MNVAVQRIYEIQNIGKGVITAITPNNLLLLETDEQSVPGLQDVILEDNQLPFGNIVLIDEYLHLDTDSGAQGGKIEVSNSGIVDNVVPASIIGKGIGNTGTDVSLAFFLDDAIFTDGANEKGLIYADDYEANFVARSLITKQYVDARTTGSETKVNAGTNTSVTGTGTTGSPYVINNTLVVDGSETKINSGITTTVAGTGTTGTPYTVEVNNNQKVLTSPGDFTANDYTLTTADFDSLIIINNGATNVTITVPTGLTSKFFAAFIQKGTGDVTFVASGTTVSSAVGLKIKGQYYQVALDREASTTTYFLTGNTKT